MLGLPYDEEFADGLQVLRYNQSTAYISHLDWIDGNSDHDYDSAVDGTNRYATIFLYLTDVEEGGETLFPQARPPQITASQASTREEALEESNRYLEAMGISGKGTIHHFFVGYLYMTEVVMSIIYVC